MINIKKFILINIILILVMSLCGCINYGYYFGQYSYLAELNKANKDKEFTIDDYGLSFTATEKWEIDDNPGEFDIQIKDGDSNISIMAYYSSEIPDGWTSEYTYEWQNEELFRKRDNVSEVEPLQVIESEGKTIFTTMISAEREEVKNYYYSCLVQFDDNEDVFAFVIFNGVPSHIMAHKEEFLKYMSSMEYEEVVLDDDNAK